MADDTDHGSVLMRLFEGRQYKIESHSDRVQMAKFINQVFSSLATDAARYRRLQILGCAVMDTPQLEAGTVVRFTGLDEIVDHDLSVNPSRGEAAPLSQ